MRRCESSEKSSIRRCSAAWLYAKLSSRIAPRIERSASTFAGSVLIEYSEVAMGRCPTRKLALITKGGEHKANNNITTRCKGARIHCLKRGRIFGERRCEDGVKV